MPLHQFFGLGMAVAASFATPEQHPTIAPYAAEAMVRDTLRNKPHSTSAGYSSSRSEVVSGYWSSWGLPPVPGQLAVTDTEMVLRSMPAAMGLSSPLQLRATEVTLAYVDHDRDGIHYIFRIDAGVFETDFPGPLLEVATELKSLDHHRPEAVLAYQPLVNPGDAAAVQKKAREIAYSPYADSLYVLFGRPAAGIGVVGPKGRRAGRLGEYIAARDSLALDPGRIVGQAQLRHALAHEMGHRWQSRSKAQLATLWKGVPDIRDPRRYGYADRSEHQAEAIAFAFSFLQATASSKDSPAVSLQLLDHYERLVPGTRIIARYLLLQPLYAGHPLRSALTTRP
jgi:hypothetical protein